MATERDKALNTRISELGLNSLQGISCGSGPDSDPSSQQTEILGQSSTPHCFDDRNCIKSPDGIYIKSPDRSVIRSLSGLNLRSLNDTDITDPEDVDPNAKETASNNDDKTNNGIHSAINKINDATNEGFDNPALSNYAIIKTGDETIKASANKDDFIDKLHDGESNKDETFSLNSKDEQSMNINTYVKCGDANIKISNEKANINPTDTSHDEPAMNTTSNAHINLEDNAQSCDDTVCENAGANSTDTQCVKDKSKEEDHENESMRLRHDMNHKIFVGNISYRVQREELAEFFSKFGKVVHSYVVKDHVKRWSRGIGFITFASQDGVKKSLGATDEELTLDGRLMRVKPSEESRRVNRHKVTKSVLQHIEDTTSQCQDNEQMQETSPDMAVQFPQDPTNITSLTDDALLTIFSYLDVRHKIKIERVCKRWRQLSIQSWHSAAIIDFSHTFNWRFGGVTDTLLQSLLARGCQNCKVLRLGNRSMCLTDWAVDIIGESCPKLEEVDLSGVEVTNISLKTLGKNCPNLKVIKLQRCHEVGEKGLWWLLKQCQDLHTIDLEGNKRLTGQCFHMAGPYLHTLNLSGCSELSESGILKISEKCKNLEDLKLNACCGLKDENLRALCRGLVHLRRLGLSGDYVELTGQGLYEIGEHLVKLEALNLSGNKAIDDRSLLNICNGCMNLKELDLSCCHSKLSDLNCLGLLYKLELVNLSYMPCVTDDCLRNISQNGRLKRIRLRACSGITNQGITAVLTGCNAIQELDLSGNLQLDNSIFDKLPYSSHKVTITAGGTSIEKETVPNGNITMTMQDLSVLHLRPDRDIDLIMDDWDEDEVMEHQGDVGDQDGEQYESNIDDIYDDPLDAERWELS